MSEVSLTVATSAHMRALGRSLATVLRAGDLVLLSGGLGAGKTTLTKGIGDGLGVRGPITSPTFVIARVHPPVGSTAVTGELRPALVHADAYRLGSALELDDLDLDTDTAASVTVVEWGGGLAEGLATDRLEITITPVKADVPVVDDPVAGDAADAGNGGDVDDPTVDAPRAVRISAVGVRWEGIKLPLARLANRL
ncbi:MAG TPA: tRNA (adenosine(37)-N6)-threonylcarbamoyltransferase complex ATPase subunit type 1 TsaE [Trebonia sp.]